MNISFTCTGCGKAMAAVPTMAGKRVRCKGCGDVVTVPGGSTPRPSRAFDDEDDLYAVAAPAALPPRPSGPASPLPGRPGAKATRKSRKSDGMSFWERQTLIFRTPWGIGALILLGVVIWQDLPGWRKAAREVRQEARTRGGARANAGGMQGVASSTGRAKAAGDQDEVPSGPIVLPRSPDLGAGVEIEPGVVLHEVAFGPAPAPASAPPGQSTRLWIYLPSGDHTPKSLPCVMIAPAGSTMLTGMDLGDGDRAEHLPWVRAGFAVIAYSLDGHVENRQDRAQVEAGLRAFLAARGGYTNAHIALEYALEKVPAVDPSRILSVGHSSAGTVAVLLAAREPRIAACVAFAAETGLRSYVSRKAANKDAPGFSSFLEMVQKIDPYTYREALKCPLYVFWAGDDTVTDPGSAMTMANALADSPGPGAASKVVTIARGGHYDAMIKEGIPSAIAWVKGLSAFAR